MEKSIPNPLVGSVIVYENKIIGELDIVLNKLILNSNNLRKHFK